MITFTLHNDARGSWARAQVFWNLELMSLTIMLSCSVLKELRGAQSYHREFHKLLVVQSPGLTENKIRWDKTTTFPISSLCCIGTNILLILIVTEINKVPAMWQLPNKNLKVPVPFLQLSQITLPAFNVSALTELSLNLSCGLLLAVYS